VAIPKLSTIINPSLFEIMAAKPKAETVTVTAACNLFEGGVHYAPGQSFDTTPDRAAALGDAVTGAPEAKPE
jgi:hypothetical protein